MNNVLTVNGGSSSLKCALYRAEEQALNLLYTLKFTDIQGQAKIRIKDSAGIVRDQHALDLNTVIDTDHHLACLEQVILWLRQQVPDDAITAISHRVVHGGTEFSQPEPVTDQLIEQLEALIPLAPLHQPYNVQLIKACHQLLPQIPQIACFDTMFHSQHSAVSSHYAIPRWLTEKGVRRYGFHGLSYEYIARQLQQLGTLEQKTIIAHLGAGASLCALANGISVATSMGFSAADGIPMATRTGNIDPGVLLYLMQSEGMDAQQIQHLVYSESGWLGASGGISSDMHTLLQSSQAEAKEAIELFCYRAGREIGSLVAATQGLEQIVFTGGIGENSAEIRQRILSHCQWLGVEIDNSSNDSNAPLISLAGSSVSVRVIATDEESVLARHCQDWLEPIPATLL